MDEQNRWLNWAIELQSLAQAGLTYGRDPYDRERYERIREISAEMVAHKSDIPTEKVKELFCNENGTWSLPGGWCDVDQSVAENTVKETFEEAGLRVTADRLIAVQDRNKHNKPIYAYGVVKIFFFFSVVGGEFVPNIETTETKYFGRDELPENLAGEKTSREQILMCFDANGSKHWETKFD
mgnify:CR=1 FL=1